jgi:membrane-associated protease RseP (regulator of RpoE activity)
LPEGKGISVDEVLPDSPAVKAGIKPHDVIVAAGDKEIATLEDLSSAIQAKGKAELALTLYRGGKKETVTVTPAEGPQVLQFKADGDVPRVFTKRLPPPGAPEGVPLQFSIVRPGIAIDIGRPLDLPEDVSVTVTKQGKTPAKIQVKRGDKTWDVEEGKVGELPEDVRPWVRRALGGPALAGRGEFEKHPHGPPDVTFRRFEAGRPFGTITLDISPTETKPATPQNVEQRLEETLKQLDALRKSVEELKSSVKKPDAPK